MSTQTQLFSAVRVSRSAPVRAAIGNWPNSMNARIGNWPNSMNARIGNWPDPMNARIGNWPDPMGRAGAAAGR